MSLISCLECGNKISDSAEACPQCGFPIREYVSFVKDEEKKIQEEQKRLDIEKEKERQRIAEEERIANIKCHECGNVIGNIEICPYCGFNMFEYKKEKELEEQKIREVLSRQNNVVKNITSTPVSNAVRCPKCGSTQIQIVNRRYSLLTGFLTNKVDRVCINCKYKW